MKKILVITLGIIFLLTFLISCGNNTPQTTAFEAILYTPADITQNQFSDNEFSYGEAGNSNSGYTFKSRASTTDLELEDITVKLFGKTYVLKYELTSKHKFHNYYRDLRTAYNPDGTKAQISVHCLSGTDTILGFLSYGTTALDMPKTAIKTENDLVSYAKTVASRYIDISKYELVIEPDIFDHCKQYNFYKFIDGYRTSEYISIILRERDGALMGIRSYCLGSYDEFKNVKFDKQAIEMRYKDHEIDSITILNDEGTLVAEVAYYVDKQSFDGSIRKELKKSHVPLTKQGSASKITTAKATTAAPPIVTTQGTTELVFTTAPAEPMLRPQG